MSNPGATFAKVPAARAPSRGLRTARPIAASGSCPDGVKRPSDAHQSAFGVGEVPDDKTIRCGIRPPWLGGGRSAPHLALAVSRVARVASELPRPSPDPEGVGFITCCSRPSVAGVLSTRDHRIELDMKQPPLNAVITFTQPSQWVWHVSLDGKRVGTVNGDNSCGFIARDVDYHSIGYGYFSAAAAIQACVPVMDPILDKASSGEPLHPPSADQAPTEALAS